MNGLKIFMLGLVLPGFFWAPPPASAQQHLSSGKDAPNVVLSGTVAQRWALLIGVEDYAEIDDQKYCADDVKDLQGRLIAAGFPVTNVFLLSDTARQPKYLPSKSNVERQLELVPMLTSKNDLLLVVYCGHAVRVDGKSYLCPIEARPEAAKETLISMDYVYRQLAAAEATCKLLVIDAARNAAGSQRSTVEEFLDSVKQPPPGIAIMVSCQPGQASLVDNGLKRGTFMRFFVKGLEGQADGDGGNSNQRISLGELCDYVRTKTGTQASQQGSHAQSPVLHGQVDADFEIGLVPKYTLDAESYPTINDDLGTTSARLEAIARITPQSMQAYNQALVSYGQSDIVEAIEYCTDSIRRDPGNTWAHILRASCYSAYGDFAKALEDYKQLGIPLPCHVSAKTAELKLGDEVTATVSWGDKLYVTKAKGEWLWVDSLGNDQAKEGWIHQKHVE